MTVRLGFAGNVREYGGMECNRKTGNKTKKIEKKNVERREERQGKRDWFK